MLIFSIYFVRASFTSHSKTSRIYHFLTSLVVIICCFAYLLMALGSQPYQPFGANFNIITIHYADWIIATPMLLYDLGMLAGMPFSECFFICFLDVMMILSGYLAHMSTDYRAAWPLFTFGCFCEALIWGTLLMHLFAIRKEKAQSTEAKTFTCVLPKSKPECKQSIV
jgi:bacteriorhodopsin